MDLGGSHRNVVRHHLLHRLLPNQLAFPAAHCKGSVHLPVLAHHRSQRIWVWARLQPVLVRSIHSQESQRQVWVHHEREPMDQDLRCMTAHRLACVMSRCCRQGSLNQWRQHLHWRKCHRRYDCQLPKQESAAKGQSSCRYSQS